MSEPPDLEGLVRRYLDLWQEQWAAMAADPELAEAFAGWFGALNQGALGIFSGMAEAARQAAGNVRGEAPKDAPSEAQQADARSRKPVAAAAAAAGPAAVGAAPRHGGDDVAELARRVAGLDERLAALEAGAGSGSGRAPPRPRRRRRGEPERGP